MPPYLLVVFRPGQPPLVGHRIRARRAAAALLAAAFLAAALLAAAFFAARARAAFHFFILASFFRLRRLSAAFHFLILTSFMAFAFESLSARAFAAFNNRMCFAFALSRILSAGFFDLQIFQPLLVSSQKSEVHLIFPVVFTLPDIIPLYRFPDMVK